jgi:N-dimethylarginine dimethylaminohydrolase
LPLDSPDHCKVLSRDEVAAIRGHRVAHAWLTPGAYRVLEVEAKRRCLHPDRLAAKVLEQVLLHDGALDAIVGW